MEKSISLTLAKLLVALSWADGELQQEELDILKDLIQNIPELTRDERVSIEVYLESPVSPSDRGTLTQQLKRLIRTEKDKEYVLHTLQRIIYADGNVDAKERKLYNLIQQSLEEEESELEEKLQHLFQNVRSKRRNAIKSLPRRERDIDTYLENPIFYRSLRALTSEGVPVQMDKSELEKLCTAGALMACIAQADAVIQPSETAQLKDILHHYWDISEEAATMVTNIAMNEQIAGLNISRMCRKFYDETDYSERMQFFDALIAIAKSDGEVDVNELERLRTIASNFRVPVENTIKLLPRPGPVPEEEMPQKNISAEEPRDTGETSSSSSPVETKDTDEISDLGTNQPPQSHAQNAKDNTTPPFRDI